MITGKNKSWMRCWFYSSSKQILSFLIRNVLLVNVYFSVSFIVLFSICWDLMYCRLWELNSLIVFIEDVSICLFWNHCQIKHTMCTHRVFYFVNFKEILGISSWNKVNFRRMVCDFLGNNSIFYFLLWNFWVFCFAYVGNGHCNIPYHQHPHDTLFIHYYIDVI